ncbi:MAG TPA: hypothetical protein DEP84_14240 [Chloroflexi bacterium]|nr:hypothetical protein [Chloroflexota bacterium]
MFKHILAPLDGSTLAECVLPHVVAMAEACRARVTLLRVCECAHTAGRIPAVDPLDWEICKTEAQAYLERLAARLGEIDVPTECVVLEGQPAESVIQFVRDSGVDLVILSSHGASGLSRWNVSSVVQKIIYRAHVATMIVRAYQPAPLELTGLRYQRLLVPLDGSKRAECILPLATMLTNFHECQLLLTHVIPRPEMARRVPPSAEDNELADRITERNRQEAVEYFRHLRSSFPTDFETRLLINNDVAATLHTVAEEEHVDLVVLAAHGYSGQTRWPFGSVTTSFIAYGTTLLLIVQDLLPEEIKPTQAEEAAREYSGH